jgi:transmembrane sensor
MSTSSPDSNLNLQIYQEACEWLIAMRTSIQDAVTRERFDAWLRKSPEHVRAYLEVSATWEDTALHDPKHLVSAETHVARARAEDNLVILDSAGTLRRASSVEVPPRKIPAERGRRPVVFAIVASVLTVTGAVGLRLYLERGVYATDVSEERSISLPDGSLVELNARSRIQVRMLAYERDVNLLQGEALFKVVHDAHRPFIVRSGDAVIRDLGTEFDVLRRETGTTVTVIAGRVAVGAPPAARSLLLGDGAHLPKPPASTALTGGPSSEAARLGRQGAGALESMDMARTLVSAGEQVTVLRQTVERPIRVDTATATAWTQRRLVFDSVPLSEVVDEFNRYNERPLVIEDRKLEDFRVIGVFSSTDPSSLIRFLSAQPGIAVIEDSQEIRITHR